MAENKEVILILKMLSQGEISVQKADEMLRSLGLKEKKTPQTLSEADAEETRGHTQTTESEWVEAEYLEVEQKHNIDDFQDIGVPTGTEETAVVLETSSEAMAGDLEDQNYIIDDDTELFAGNFGKSGTVEDQSLDLEVFETADLDTEESNEDGVTCAEITEAETTSQIGSTVPDGEQDEIIIEEEGIVEKEAVETCSEDIGENFNTAGLFSNVQEKPGSKTLFRYYNNEHVELTEFRRLARNVRNGKITPEVKSVLVTSAMKNEGKSLIAANLAITIARREVDKKVLLIDWDLRKPSVHSLFGIDRKPGLSSILTEQMEPIDLARDTEIDNLKIIPSGKITDSPSKMLAIAKDALDKCKRQFDIIVCDAPPIIPFDDVATLVPQVDGILLVVLAGKTDRAIVKRAVDILNEAHARILGVALNDLHGALPYYYDYRYYRYENEGNRE